MNIYKTGVNEIISAVASSNKWDYERAANSIKTLCDRLNNMIECAVYGDSLNYLVLIEYFCKCTRTEAENIYRIMTS